MTRRRLLVVAAALFITAHAAELGDRDRILTRLGRVAELYRDNALGFACEETIAFSQRRIPFAYLFVRDEDGRLHDFRTGAKGTPARERAEVLSPADYQVPAFLESAYCWAFIFRADHRSLYRFDVFREDTALGRPAVMIEFVPKEPIRKGLNDWAGYAWVDRETTQLLVVQAYLPADWDRKMRRDAKHRDSSGIERFVTEFGFEKNGIRFPSHVEINSPAGKVTQDYANFEFFSVRSSDEIMRFVNGDAPLPPAPTSPDSR